MASSNIKLLSFSEVEDNGAFQAHDLNPAKANDLATINVLPSTNRIALHDMDATVTTINVLGEQAPGDGKFISGGMFWCGR